MIMTKHLEPFHPANYRRWVHGRGITQREHCLLEDTHQSADQFITLLAEPMHITPAAKRWMVRHYKGLIEQEQPEGNIDYYRIGVRIVKCMRKAKRVATRRQANKIALRDVQQNVTTHI